VAIPDYSKHVPEKKEMSLKRIQEKVKRWAAKGRQGKGSCEDEGGGGVKGGVEWDVAEWVLGRLQLGRPALI
jgi:hypothetical protein